VAPSNEDVSSVISDGPTAVLSAGNKERPSQCWPSLAAFDPDPSRHLASVREGWEALASHSVGLYVNLLSDEGTAGVQAAYGKRLARLIA
jgi:hypothetical protein